MSEKDMRGRDISAPADRIELGGSEYPLKFDMNAFRVAEDVYELQYGRSLNFAVIMRQLIAGRLGAIMAVMYGALLSGARDAKEKPVTWEEFSEKFTLTSIPGVQDKLLKKLKEALPEAEENPTQGVPAGKTPDSPGSGSGSGPSTAG